jgi:hypothetical protein
MYDRDSTQQIAGTLETFSTASTGPLTDANIFTDIAPDLVLAPGHSSVVAWGYNMAAMNGNAGAGPIASFEDNGGGLIDFVGVARFGPAKLWPRPRAGDYYAGRADIVRTGAEIPEKVTADNCTTAGLVRLFSFWTQGSLGGFAYLE